MDKNKNSFMGFVGFEGPLIGEKKLVLGQENLDSVLNSISTWSPVSILNLTFPKSQKKTKFKPKKQNSNNVTGCAHYEWYIQKCTLPYVLILSMTTQLSKVVEWFKIWKYWIHLEPNKTFSRYKKIIESCLRNYSLSLHVISYHMLFDASDILGKNCSYTEVNF